MYFLKTERLILRPLAEKDVPVMYDYRNNAICARYQRGQAKERDKIAALVARRKNDTFSVDAPFMVAVALRDTDEMVGEITVMPQDFTVSLGYTFSYRHHRKGYAYEALSALIGTLRARFPAWDFVSFTDPENAASIALLKKLGYTDMGYIASMQSRAFCKWPNPETAAELTAAAAHAEKQE